VLVALVGQLCYIRVDFGFQGGGEHPPRALADDVVDQEAGLGRSLGIHHAQHGRAFPTDGATSAYSMTRSRSLGKVRPLRPTRGRSTGHEHCSENRERRSRSAAGRAAATRRRRRPARHSSAAASRITGIPERRILVVIQDSPARSAVEGGQVLPGPGQEKEWLSRQEA
jgi:hypothetical protein